MSETEIGQERGQDQETIRTRDDEDPAQLKIRLDFDQEEQLKLPIFS